MRVTVTQVGRREPETTKGAGRQVLDKYVSAAQQVMQQLLILVITQVQGDAFLTRIQPDEVGALTFNQGIEPSGKVTLLTFNFDDPCPFFGHAPGHIGRRNRLLQGNHRNTGKIGHCLHAGYRITVDGSASKGSRKIMGKLPDNQGRIIPVVRYRWKQEHSACTVVTKC